MQMLTQKTQPTKFPPETRSERPFVVTVPGIDGSGPNHWQSYWDKLSNFSRAELPSWSRPELHPWVSSLDKAIRGAGRPVALAAHSLGCLAVAWWAALTAPRSDLGLCGALLVAPPDPDTIESCERMRGFGPIPRVQLPFPTMLVASRNDPYASFARSEELARLWGSDLIDAGRAGHINADSGLAEWPAGLRLLCSLTGHNPNLMVAELGLRTALA